MRRLIASCAVLGCFVLTVPQAADARDTPATITGTVVDLAGQPVSGVKVLATDDQFNLRGTATTATDGTYTMSVNGPVVVAVCFDAANGIGATSSPFGYRDECYLDAPDAGDADEVSVPAGGMITGIDASLAPAAGVQGTVTDPSGAPVRGVRVVPGSFDGIGGPNAAPVTTDRAGSYRVTGLVPGAYFAPCLYADGAHGGSSTTGYLDECDDLVVHVGAGGRWTDAPDHPLMPAAQILGTVTAPDGSPVRGVRVIGNLDDSGRSGQDVTDAQGRYRLIGDGDGDARLYPGTWQLRFDTSAVPEFAMSHRDDVEADGGTPTVIDETLVRTARISGTLTDVDGAPVAGIEVDLHGDGSGYTFSDAAGSFSFTGIGAGTYRVCFQTSDFRTGPAAPYGYVSGCWHDSPLYQGDPITLAAGEQRTDIDQTLTSAGRITGTVTDMAGRPLQSVDVTSGSRHDLSDSGSYSIPGIEPGPATVCFDALTFPGLPKYRFECWDDQPDEDHATPVPVSAAQSSTADAVLALDDPDDHAPPVQAMTAPQYRVQRAAVFNVGVTSTDDHSGTASYDIRYRTSAWKGAFGDYIYPSDWQWTTSPSRSFTATPGTTYCFSTRARDFAGHLSYWSAERCTVVPLDDRALSTHGAWTRTTLNTAYRQTITRSTEPKVSLTLTGAQASGLSLVVTTCPSCGKLRLDYAGHTRVIDTYSAQRIDRVLVAVPAYAVMTTDVTITNVSAGTRRTVVIDGIALSRL